MSPSTLLIAGIVSALIGIFGLILNIGSAVGHRSERSLASVFIMHGICALFYIGGAISVVTAIVMFLINYAKN